MSEHTVYEAPDKNWRGCLYIGRFSPYHKGHDYIIRKSLDAGKNVVIAIRDTPITDKDPYTSFERHKMLKRQFEREIKEDRVRIITIPDIESVNIGRKVGYDVIRFDVPEQVGAISATEIRQRMKDDDTSWEACVPTRVANYLKAHAIVQTGNYNVVIWLTGIPCSGKSTIAEMLGAKLRVRGDVVARVKILDGDEVRRHLSSDLGFSKEDRKENIRRVACVAKMFVDQGYIVITAFVSPYWDIRTMAKTIIGPNRFFEVHVRCPVGVAEERDVKGMYAKARAGDIKGFTGVDDPYEAPEYPACVVDTDKNTVDECVEKILGELYW